MEILKAVDEGQLFFVGDVENTSLIAGSREIQVEKFQWTPTVTVSAYPLVYKKFSTSNFDVEFIINLLSHNLDHNFSQSTLGWFLSMSKVRFQTEGYVTLESRFHPVRTKMAIYKALG